jgi:hypothetical protein
MLREVSPDFEDQQGAISLVVSTRRYPQAAAAEYAYTLSENAPRRDLRASGSVIALTFSGASNPSYMRMGKPVFDAVLRGRR